MMTDNNHTTTVEPSMSVHEESLLRSTLNRRAVPAPDVDEEWKRLSPFVEAGPVPVHKESEKRGLSFERIFHISIAVAAMIVLLWVIVPPILRDKSKVTAQHDKEQIDSPSLQQKRNIVENKTYAGKTATQTEEVITPITISVPKASLRKIALPDGTNVWLNAGSEIKYAFTKTEGERRVKLEGEGYFEVRHDSQRPFVVDAGSISITDIGTEFNVKAYEGIKPEVVVVEGCVKASLSADNTRVLAAGKQAQVSGGKIIVTSVDTYPYIQWRNGLFYFHDTTLLDAMKEIGRWYGCNIIIENNADITARIHFVAERNLSLRQIVAQLNDIDGVNISYSNGEITVR